MFDNIFIQFVYGCLYLLFEAYPIVYTEGHNLNYGPSGLVYLPLPLGSLISVAVVRIISLRQDQVLTTF